MSKLTKKDVEHVARLSNLKLTPQETEKYLKQLSEVINYVEGLGEVDTSQTEPTSQTTGLEDRLRLDEGKAERTLTKDEALSGTDKTHKDLNALLAVCEEEAYKKAKEVDERIKSLKEKAFTDFPLLGIPVSYKDLFLTKGVRTTAGSKVLQDYVPPYSATVVERLEKAGCIMLGKTNCDAWAHGASGENSDFGPTRNPWNKDFVPGGSSSGSESL